VTIAGPVSALGSQFDGGYPFWNREFYVPRLVASDAVGIVGSNGNAYTLTFGAPVQDPILHLGSLASTLAFPAGTVITKVSGQDTLTVTGSSVSGVARNLDETDSTDSNGTVRIQGLIGSISFSATPTFNGGTTNDGIYLQVGTAITAPGTAISLTPAEPTARGAYEGSARVQVSSTGDATKGSLETRCVLDPAAAPTRFDDLPAGCPYLQGADVTGVGTHIVYAATRDYTGNADAPVSRAFRVVAAPDTVITAAPAAASWDNAPQFSFTSTIADSTFECQFDAGTWTPCGVPYALTRVASGGHVFKVRAVSPDGVKDATPAEHAFVVNHKITVRPECQVKPVYWRLIMIGRNVPDRYACAIGTLGSGGCPSESVCVSKREVCPRGARCTVTTKLSWFDADERVNWGPIATARLGTIRRAAVSYGGRVSENLPSASRSCRTGYDGDRCYAQARLTVLGDGSPMFSGCEIDLVPGGGLLGETQFRSDSVRRIECDAEWRVEPSPSYSAVATGPAVQVQLPSAGVLLAVTSLRFKASQASAVAAAAPKIESVRTTVPRAGVVTLRPKLNTEAKRLLARRRKLPVTVRLTFTPTAGAPVTTTQHVTLTPQPASRTALCKKLRKTKRLRKLRCGTRAAV